MSIPAPLEAETLRRRHARHSTDPACASCHRRIDPLGFAFEHYDHRGRHRREDRGAAIDASGTVLADGEVHAFDDLSGLVTVLSQSEAVRRCWTWTWVRVLLPGEPPATVEGLVEAVVAGTTSETPLRDVLETIVTSDRFRRLARLDAPPDTQAPPWGDAPSAGPAAVPLEVRSLVDHRCAPCHFAGGDAHDVADFSTDDDLAAHARQAVALVRAESMPPDEPLSPREREVLLRWLEPTTGVASVAPSGNDIPKAR